MKINTITTAPNSTVELTIALSITIKSSHTNSPPTITITTEPNLTVELTIALSPTFDNVVTVDNNTQFLEYLPNNKAKALSKDETKALLSLIEGSAIITNKATDATNNKLKMEERVRITTSFNASCGTCRRTPQQLRLKWENLKKNSRKRNTQIRMNRIKTGGGAPPYISPDEILDRVSTVDGFTVEFGGDSEQVVDYGDGAIINEVEKELPLDNGDGQEVPFLVINTPASVGPALPKRLFWVLPETVGADLDLQQQHTAH
ncbi:unnamed protein product [Colias eurytheme]|nr:unnamed protein product [Colias eurytheme]